MTRVFIVLPAFALATAVSTALGAEPREMTLEQGREAIQSFMEERRLETEPALELFSALAGANVSVTTSVDLIQKAVQKDPQWDLSELTSLVYDRRTAGFGPVEIEVAVREAIHAHEAVPAEPERRPDEQPPGGQGPDEVPPENVPPDRDR